MDKILSGLFSSRKVAIFSHLYPDGDTIGSQLALAEGLDQHGVEVKCYNFMPLPAQFTFLNNSHLIQLPKNENFLDDIDVVCFVDCGELSRTGLSEKALENKVVYNIDHHKSNTYFGKYNFIVDNASSTCEVIYDILKSYSCKFTPSLATCLYLGLSTDTGSFKYSNTTAKSHLIASDLISHNADVNAVRLNIYENISLSRYRLLGFIYQATKFYANDKIAYISITIEDEKALNIQDDDYSGIASVLKEISGVEVAVLMRSLSSDKTKISLRSKSYLDVSIIAEKFGGGGHARAAGVIVNKSLENAEKAILNELEENLMI